jgi:hypothetical protein
MSTRKVSSRTRRKPEIDAFDPLVFADRMNARGGRMIQTRRLKLLNRIVTTRMKRVTPRDAAYAHPSAAHNAVTVYSLISVF